MPGEISPHLAPLPTSSFSTGGSLPQVPGDACFPFSPGGVGHRPPALAGGARTVVVCMDAQVSTFIVCPRRQRTARATQPLTFHLQMGLWLCCRISLTVTPTFPLVARGSGDPSARPRCISDLVGSVMVPSAHARLISASAHLIEFRSGVGGILKPVCPFSQLDTRNACTSSAYTGKVLFNCFPPLSISE